jgi:hypothetical protein
MQVSKIQCPRCNGRFLALGFHKTQSAWFYVQKSASVSQTKRHRLHSHERVAAPRETRSEALISHSGVNCKQQLLPYMRRTLSPFLLPLSTSCFVQISKGRQQNRMFWSPPLQKRKANRFMRSGLRTLLCQKHTLNHWWSLVLPWRPKSLFWPDIWGSALFQTQNNQNGILCEESEKTLQIETTIAHTTECAVCLSLLLFSLRSTTSIPSHYLKSYFQKSHRQHCILRAGAQTSLLKNDVDVVCGAGCSIKRHSRLDYKVLLLSPSLSTPQYPSSPRYLLVALGIEHGWIVLCIVLRELRSISLPASVVGAKPSTY